LSTSENASGGRAAAVVQRHATWCNAMQPIAVVWQNEPTVARAPISILPVMIYNKGRRVAARLTLPRLSRKVPAP